MVQYFPTSIMISKTTQSLFLFIVNYYSGGQISGKNLPPVTIGKIYCGTLKKFESINCLFDSDIIYVKDLSFELSTTDSFNIISKKKIAKTNSLIWAGLHHSIPSHLKLITLQLSCWILPLF